MIAALVVALSVVTMAIDHLFGTESEPGESWPVDPSAFVLSIALALALTAVLFRFVVISARPENATRRAVVCSVWPSSPFHFSSSPSRFHSQARVSPLA